MMNTEQVIFRRVPETKGQTLEAIERGLFLNFSGAAQPEADHGHEQQT